MIHVKIPGGRIGVLIGADGSTKRQIEERSGATLRIDSESGSVAVDSPDPINAMRVGEVVRAIGRGFSPEKALSLFDDEALVFDLIDLSDVLPTQKDIKRVKGRIIGKNGSTRELIEGLIDVKISVYGKTVGIIGDVARVQVARKAIGMLIEGVPHGTVYAYLEKKRREWKITQSLSKE
ncbi:MAG: KH domain-containing protein [Methanocellales archaeon]|nr:KH domain-containing protein [Methanocellales archaeon]